MFPELSWRMSLTPYSQSDMPTCAKVITETWLGTQFRHERRRERDAEHNECQKVERIKEVLPGRENLDRIVVVCSICFFFFFFFLWVIEIVVIQSQIVPGSVPLLRRFYDSGKGFPDSSHRTSALFISSVPAGRYQSGMNHRTFPPSLSCLLDHSITEFYQCSRDCC